MVHRKHGLAFLVLLSGFLSSGTTWHVEYDPADPVDRIGRAVSIAGDGDTIIVGPGVYNEHISLTERSLTLVSSSGPETTILDGSVPLIGREASILYAVDLNIPQLAITGFTLRRGGGTNMPWCCQMGGAIALLNRDGLPSQVRIKDCVFEENVLNEPFSGSGSAIFMEGPHAEIEQCRFRRNISNGSAGDLYLHLGRYVIRDCQFEIEGSRAHKAAVLLSYGAEEITMENCEIRGAAVMPSEHAILTSVWSISFIGNRFLDNGDASATQILLNSDGMLETYPQYVVFEKNVFWNTVAAAGRYPEVMHGQLQSFARYEGNTFINTDVGIVTGGSVEFRRNIVWNSQVTVDANSGLVECNDVWPDSTALVESSGMVTGTNLNADPLFCDEEAGNFQIAEESPCAPGNAPVGCSGIGALGVGCRLEAIEKTTWGRLRQMFR